MALSQSRAQFPLEVHIMVGVYVPRTRKVGVVNFARVTVANDSVESLLDAAAVYGGEILHYVKDVKRQVNVFGSGHSVQKRLHLEDRITPHLDSSLWDGTHVVPHLWIVLGWQFRFFLPFEMTKGVYFLTTSPELSTCDSWFNLHLPCLLRQRGGQPGWDKFVDWTFEGVLHKESAAAKRYEGAESEQEWGVTCSLLRPDRSKAAAKGLSASSSAPSAAHISRRRVGVVHSASAK
eukprot:TRINITY_DN8192_c0_g1_i1.p1 TRINITY_DN8192_c0_g1~~TRINITY_DN8192_c0_g1_i1.p1  ORF type:complete len:235 (+),score=17.05 TRINITY_DN8192_c0_g1_i1:414-1118(+)